MTMYVMESDLRFTASAHANQRKSLAILLVGGEELL
jgi:hypothetical protein